MSPTPSRVGTEGRVGERASLPGLPEGLFVAERQPAGGWGDGAGPVVVLVHGSLDRASSFRRVARRLDDLGVVTYDRRGYRGSRGAPVSDDLAVHVEDLVRIARAYAEHGHRKAPAGVVAVGHSAGGTIVLGAAVERPELFRAVGAYEPTMPWLGFHGESSRPSREDSEEDHDPGLGAERFFRRVVGDGAWERLSEEQRDALRADGAALLADLRALRRPDPFDVTALAVPAIVASGGPSSFPNHLATANWLAAHVTAVRRSTIPCAGHGAHLSHPDAFAALVRDVAAIGARARARVRDTD
jgi:pimeloyl-ACP methyl ester carboxylesterase